MKEQREQGAERAPYIYRHVSFEFEAFNKLKEYQRKLEIAEGRTMTNGEALSRFILNSPLK